jgi:hypothetical protein
MRDNGVSEDFISSDPFQMKTILKLSNVKSENVLAEIKKLIK